ncbi:hypothetical protein OH775_50090 [Streptomyces sp. NBC_01615]
MPSADELINRVTAQTLLRPALVRVAASGWLRGSGQESEGLVPQAFRVGGVECVGCNATGPAIELNAIRSAFLDPRLRSLYLNWGEMTIRAVAGLRALIGPDDSDPRIVELVNELSTDSETFRRLWARHDVSPGAPAPHR